MSQVQRIDDFIGQPLTGALRGAMEAHRVSHPKKRFGCHRYSLEEFGLG